MAPNLFVAVKTMCHPETWFREKPSRDLSLVQVRHEPVPGIYKYIGNNWCLIRREAVSGTKIFDADVEPPVAVVYSKVLKRWIFEEDFIARQRKGYVEGHPHWRGQAGFFRLDDGISWVHCFDNEGEFIPGPYKRYCFDKETEKFRVMLKGDGKYGEDERWLRRRSEEISSSRNSSRSRDSSKKERSVTRGTSTKTSSLARSERSQSPLQSSATSMRSTSRTDQDGKLMVGVPITSRRASERSALENDPAPTDTEHPKP